MSGDSDAFGTLASGALARLVGTAGLILGSHDAAEDAVQESLVRAWRDLPALRDPDRFDAWMYRVLVRTCHDEGRRARRSPISDVDETSLTAVDDHAATFAERDAIAAGLRRLGLEHRTVLVLRFYLDMSYEEMAVTLNVPVGTAKSRVSRALSSMRAALAAIERGTTEQRPA
jgi:RNA polymerase sigma-70 factor (ECF subfamily)